MATNGVASPSFEDRTDFENASRGLINSLKPCIIKNSEGRVVWNNDQYDFLKEECPATANPKLWRQAQLVAMQGLYKVTAGIYQIRGFDMSNMTVVEGKTGVIVIDPLVSNETAAAALALYRQHRGDRPVTGLIYSHPHIDHYGGAGGVLPRESALEIPIIAPDRFMEELTSENIFAGPAMRRRAAYQYGNYLEKSAKGQLGCGIGMTVSDGTHSLIPPTVLVEKTGEEHVVDGVRIIFQVVPCTEAPAEVNFFFPDHKALCISECATHCMHNIVTLRGAQVRDAKAWSGYLDETLDLFGEGSDVLFASHNWPTWGHDELCNMIAEQRDFYAYIHDQTIRLMNTGLTGIEIAEKLTLPSSLAKAWHLQGFYGSISHNVKGIYQRYLTWFDGNPVHLWQYPPKEEGERFVSCMGGIDQLISKAEGFATSGDVRFAATLLGHATAAQPTHTKARLALASVLEQLGYGAENGIWRNFFLTGAQDMRGEERLGRGSKPFSPISPVLSVEQLLGGLSVRIDGLKAQKEKFTIDILIVDEKQRWRVNLSNGALTYRRKVEKETFTKPADVSISLTKVEFLEMLKGNLEMKNKTCDGDSSLISRLLSLAS